jgi:phospholipid/cholesterol/gamma-HCH transport system substrate-binding protein
MGKVLFNHRFLGVVFIGVLVLGLWLVNAVFSQKFVSFDKVTLTTDNVGLQLPARADVKIRGVIIGQVLDAKAGRPGSGAVLTLGIQPDKMHEVPANVSASILPKTLFGEKYVELNIPQDPSSEALADGAHIGQTHLPIEVERVLSDLYPLLRTVQPAEINYTLNAIATALEGRGNEIGQNIETLDRYLKRFNPEVPALIRDLKLLSRVSGTYADVIPQVAATLRNTVKTGNTLLSRQAKLRQFLRDTAAFSDTTKQFLDANGDNIIRLGQVSTPVLALLARYSPEFPCLLDGIVREIPLQASTFRGFVFHIQLINLPQQPRGYGPQDAPVYGADIGPNCQGLPNPPGSPAHPYQAPNVRDGVDDHGGTLGRGDNQRVATGFARRAGAPRIASGVTGTRTQQQLVAALTAPVLGVPASEVPDITTLLFTPMAAGTQVNVE